MKVKSSAKLGSLLISVVIGAGLLMPTSHVFAQTTASNAALTPPLQVNPQTPVISGVKGPTALKVGETGTWSVSAYDPENGPLSYSVIWGDESSMPVPTPLPLSAAPIQQKTTFTHSYARKGIYTPVFYVTDNQGFSIKTRISVNVGATTPQSAGYLYISPISFSVGVGQQQKIQAFFQPPMPPCSQGSVCTQVMPAPYAVHATWSSSNARIATVLADPNGKSLSATVRGVAGGAADIKASFVQYPNSYTAKATVEVKPATTQPSITVLSPNGRENWRAGSIQIIKWRTSKPASICARNVPCPTPTPIPPAPVTITLKSPPINCKTAPCPRMPEFLIVIANNIPDSGQFSWTVGKNINGVEIPSGKYVIQVSNSAASDSSNAPFSIVQVPQPTANRILGTFANDFKATSATIGANVNVVEPNSTLFFIYGTNSNLTNYSCGKGSGCIQTQGIAVKASRINEVYSLSVNNLLPQTQYYFRAYINNNVGGVIESPVNRFMSAQSAPSLTVTSPNGKEAWQKGTTQIINWKSSDGCPNGATCVGVVPLVDIFQANFPIGCSILPCPAEPGFGKFIAKNVTDNGVFAWEVGKYLDNVIMPDGQYKIRVYRSGTNIFDESDAPFSIVSATVQDTVSLQSITIEGNNIRVRYSKNFVTCAHLLTPIGVSVNIQNFFCSQGNNIEVVQPQSSFTSNVMAGQQLKLCHGNNYGICSSLVTVTANATPSITVLSPNGGEIMKRGNDNLTGDNLTIKYEIKNSASAVGDYSIYIVSRNDSNFRSEPPHYYIGGASGVTGGGISSVTTQINSSFSLGNYYALVEWKDKSGYYTYDVSDAPFSIVAAEPASSLPVRLLLGDVTLDGRQRSIDPTFILQYANGTRKFTELQKLLADVDLDGKITQTDANNLLSSMVGDRPAYPALTFGNVSLSGTVNSLDGAYILRHIAGTRILSRLEKLLADVNSDGAITQADADAILQSLVELKPALPALFLGDVSLNGELSSLDGSYVLQYVAGTRALTDLQKLLADVNSDGVINQTDVDMILNAVVGNPLLLPPPLPQPSITVLSPNGWESLANGSQMTIRWSTQNFPNVPVNLSLFTSAVTPTTETSYQWVANVAYQTANDGSETWTIPANIAPGTRYFIRILGYDATGYVFPNGCGSGCRTDDSDAPFSIVAASTVAQCADKIDNDGDGKIDFSSDPGCMSVYDNNEAEPFPEIFSINPATAKKGDIVKILGKGFIRPPLFPSLPGISHYVKFGSGVIALTGGSADPSGEKDTLLLNVPEKVCVTTASPSAILSGSYFCNSYFDTLAVGESAKSYEVSIVTNQGTSNAITFTVVAISTQPSITVTSPNGWEAWQLNNLHTILWQPYDPNAGINPATDVTAYLEKLVNGSYMVVGKIIPSGKASIHWVTEIDRYGNYPLPGDYYIKIVNNKTGASDRSNASFKLVAVDTIKADIKINGSDGPVTIPTTGADYKVTWSSNAQYCEIYNGSLTSNDPGYQMLNLPPVGDKILHFAANMNAYSQGLKLTCYSKSPVEGWGSDDVALSPLVLGVVAIESPNGGEKIPYTNDTTAISWRFTPDIYQVSLALYKNDMFFNWIAPNLQVSGAIGAYKWSPTNTISSANIGNDVFKIYIIGYKSTGGTVEDKSDLPFSIVAGGLPDLEIKNAYPNTSDAPYGFWMNLCINGSKSINDLKLENPLVKGYPFHYYFTDANGNVHFDPNNLGGGGVENLKNGQCTTMASNIQINDRSAFETSNKSVKIVVDQDNIINENNENNNIFTFNLVSTPTPSITVLSPNGGEQWSLQTNQNIRWISNTSDKIGIKLVPLSGSNVPPQDIALFLNNTGSQQWSISSADVSPGSYQIRICILNSAGSCIISDSSDAPFSIVSQTQPSVKIMYPVANATLTSKNITASGTCSNYSSSVDVFYYSDKKEESIVQCVSGKWSTNISINSNAGSGSFDLYAQLYPPLSSNVQDQIKLYFNWSTQPSITVLSPNGGEVWNNNSTQTVNWTSSNIPNNASVLVSLRSAMDSYIGSSLLSSSLLNSGSGNVTIGNNIAPGLYKLELAAYVNGQYVFDQSNAPFSIVAAISNTGPTVSPSKTSAIPGEKISAKISNGPANALDWVGLYLVGSDNESYLDWKYLNNTQSGPDSGVSSATLDFTIPTTPGKYEFRLLANNGYTSLASSPAVVVATLLMYSPTSSQTASVFDAVKPIWWPTGF